MSATDTDTSTLPDYAPVPRSALGPALNEQGYYVGQVERNLYWITAGTYQSAFLTTSDGVVLLDAPPTIGHNIRRAVDEIAYLDEVTAVAAAPEKYTGVLAARGRFHREHDVMGGGVDTPRPRLRLAGAPLMAINAMSDPVAPPAPTDPTRIRELMLAILFAVSGNRHQIEKGLACAS